MNNDTDKDYDLLEIVSGARSAFDGAKIQKTLAENVQKLCNDMKRQLYDDLLELPAGADMQDYTNSTEAWNRQFEEFHATEFIPQKTSMFKPIMRNMRVLDKIRRTLDSMQVSGREMQRRDIHSKDINKEFNALASQFHGCRNELDSYRSAILQECIWKLAAHQTNELKDWCFMDKLSPYSRYIQAPTPDTRPSMTVDIKKPGFSLPQEIMSMIYTSADLCGSTTSQL